MSTAFLAIFLLKMITAEDWGNTPTGVSLKPHFPPPNPSQPPDNEEPDVNECFETDHVYRTNKGLLKTFSTSGALQCWQYCKYTFKCRVLSFEIVNSTCSLFSIDAKSRAKVDKGSSVIIYRHCMEFSKVESLGASIKDIIRLSQSRVGFLIEQAVSQITCLTKGKSLKMVQDTLITNISYRLMWAPCTEGSKWVLKELKDRELEAEEDDVYQLSPADELDLCLDVLQDGMLRMAILSTCRNVSDKEEDPQLIFVRSELSISYQDVYSILSKFGGKYSGDIIFTGKGVINYAKSFYGVSFREPSFYEQEGPSHCPLSQFSTPHGVMRNKENVPFVLPGSQVEIQCDQGYGLKNRNYTSTQTLVCSEDAKPRLCTRIISTKSGRVRNKESGKEDLYHLFLAVGIVSTIIAVMLLVMLLKKRRQQKKTENEEIGEAEGIQVTNITVVSELDLN